MSEVSPGRVIGRYALFDVLASGGMATVHLARLLGPVGFARTVAIKRLHPQFARDPEFVSMFLDEARMCARIRHPNVVPTIDVVATSGELFLVMEYIQGEALSHLIKPIGGQGKPVPWRVAVGILAGALHGLHAAHEAKDERGLPLGLVHRDISPQNILVGVDGMARVVDFGIAKATGRLQTTRAGAVKGKLGYMAPEQMAADGVERQADVYAAGVVLWELLTGRRLFDGDSEAIVLARVLTLEVPPPSSLVPGIPREIDAVVMKGLTRKVTARYQTAREFASALEKLGAATLGEVGDWVEEHARTSLAERAHRVHAVETGSGGLTPVPITEPSANPPEPLPYSSRSSAASFENPAPPSLPSSGAAVEPPVVVQTARSGSIRPMARSEPEARLPKLPVERSKPPFWVIPAAVTVAMLGLYSLVVAFSDTEPEGASVVDSRAAVGAAPTTGATLSAVPSLQTPLKVDPPETASAAPSPSVIDLDAAPAPSASAATASTEKPKLWGKMPKAPGKNPFNLGGRN